MTRERVIPGAMVRALVAIAALAGALLSGIGTREPAKAPPAATVAEQQRPQRDVLAEALPAVTRRLSRERREARRALAASKNANGQAGAARQARAAYAGAAERLAAVRSTDPRRARGVAALRRTARGYEALAKAAAAESGRRFREAAAAITKAERAVRRDVYDLSG